MRTFNLRKEDVKQQWFVADASGKILGRFATEIAAILRGKRNIRFTPHVDCGEHIIVINAGRINISGKKNTDKIYYKHSGYIGGIKAKPYTKLLQSNPCEIIMHAVKGMLPKGPLGRRLIRKLKIYSGSDHPHVAQQPVDTNL